MKCKYLRIIKSGGELGKRPQVHIDDRNNDTPTGSSALWLCRYGIDTGKDPALGIRHCPFSISPAEQCLYKSDGGPFPLQEDQGASA